MLCDSTADRFPSCAGPPTHQRHGALLQRFLILDLNVCNGDVLVLGKIRHRQGAEGLDHTCTCLLFNILNHKATFCAWVQAGHELFEGRTLSHLCIINIINTEQSASYIVFLLIPCFPFVEEPQIPKHLPSTKVQREAKNRSLALARCPAGSAACACGCGVTLGGRKVKVCAGDAYS